MLNCIWNKYIYKWNSRREKIISNISMSNKNNSNNIEHTRNKLQKNRWNWGISEGILLGIRRIQATNYYYIAEYLLPECAVEAADYPVYNTMIPCYRAILCIHKHTHYIVITTCLSFIFHFSLYHTFITTALLCWPFSKHTNGWPYHGIPAMDEYSLKSNQSEKYYYYYHTKDSRTFTHHPIDISVYCDCDCACEIVCKIIIIWLDACMWCWWWWVIMMRKSYHVVLFTPNLCTYLHISISIRHTCIPKKNEYGFRQQIKKDEQKQKKINDFEWYTEWPINNHIFR